MAPNVITLLGLSFILMNSLTVLYYDPYLNEASPRWVYFSYAIGLFLYQTFDGCDGVHARRTGQSGPLGELFDHSIDAVNTSLSFFVFCSAAALGYSPKMIICQFFLLCNFYVSTWEEYHTHKLFLSEVSGPVEGILCICLSFLITGFFSSQFWHITLMNLQFGNNMIDIEVLDLFLLSLCIGIIFNIAAARENIRKYYENEKTNTLVGNNTEPFTEYDALKGLLPFFIYYISVFVLIMIDTEFVSFPLFISIGFSVAFVVGRIIVAHLTKQYFPYINFPMFIPSVQLILYLITVRMLGYDPSKITFALTWFGLGSSVGIHAMFMNEIIYEFTTFLDVWALSVKHSKYT
ncbi:bifunctional diacylglycerol cholinephosphotransferase/ethanolaminephosphotransferase NDAI_0B04390 [Naumovozyma dairenensis CBS 421]|uniref:Ethanolaminephosphotransferase n=1 Tax=Naumovozyma dairenensis (strain ATCC 10597 / BCRC 20456 / CBS 421 / NBRC 0211 / NRRL Y-12639) TaxID=1071378 RepID=G0W6R2_NAUDC|nr:hypothetical protein NDAI_0B04390 [Naumovozyma dairenensis CBS 421]CCD23473.1 hypothetical protein NDAI_0B04390 [Naumovozyma dairenensis CBS 421]